MELETMKHSLHGDANNGDLQRLNQNKLKTNCTNPSVFNDDLCSYGPCICGLGGSFENDQITSTIVVAIVCCLCHISELQDLSAVKTKCPFLLGFHQISVWPLWYIPNV